MRVEILREEAFMWDPAPPPSSQTPESKDSKLCVSLGGCLTQLNTESVDKFKHSWQMKILEGQELPLTLFPGSCGFNLISQNLSYRN